MRNTLDLADLPHGVLAMLAREYLLCGHLIDRAGMPYVISSFDRTEMGAIAVDEWMGASPVYTRRMQKLLGMKGDDVATIFKGMQFDIGAPHGFLDFRYTVHDEHHGGFQLDHCGALMDVEPMGEEFVFTMCHDIEDPTFDATAAATNPRARMRPLHRPPRDRTERVPHCAWTVEIDPRADPTPEAHITKVVAGSAVAATPLPSIAGCSSGGVDPGDEGRAGLRADYSGPLADRIATEEFTSAALVAIIEELCLQQHILAHSFMVAVAHRHGEEVALELGEHQFVGSAGMSAHRLAAALRSTDLGPEGSSLDAVELVAQVLVLHPALRPSSYLDVRVDLRGDAAVVALFDCPATAAGSRLSWGALLRDGCHRALRAVAAAVDPALCCEVADDPSELAPGALLAWRVHPGPTPVAEEPEVTLARFSTGTDFDLAPRDGTGVVLRRS